MPERGGWYGNGPVNVANIVACPNPPFRSPISHRACHRQAASGWGQPGEPGVILPSLQSSQGTEPVRRRPTGWSNRPALQSPRGSLGRALRDPGPSAPWPDLHWANHRVGTCHELAGSARNPASGRTGPL